MLKGSRKEMCREAEINVTGFFFLLPQARVYVKNERQTAKLYILLRRKKKGRRERERE